MKDKLALAAVLNTLRNLLEQGMRNQLAGLNVDVTVLPPDKVPDDRNIINLFVYELRLNAAFRNRPLPGRNGPLDTSPPPLPLDVFFMVSAFAVDNTDLNAHRMLGLALSVLHDTPLLGPPIQLTDGDATYVYDKTERVRLTPHPLSLDELTKIWTGFKGPLAPSLSYQVSVVLLESDLPGNAPPPVLRRGEDDGGPAATASPVPPFPNITELNFGQTEPPRLRRHPLRQPVFERGDKVQIKGAQLTVAGQSSHVRLRPPGNAALLDLPVSASSATEIMAALDPALATHAGYHRLFVEVPTQAGRDPLRSPEVPLLVAPLLAALSTDTLTFPAPPAAGEPRPPQPLTATTDVVLLPAQDVRLLLGSTEVSRDALPAANQALFSVPELPPGLYPARLRVDGVDSLPIMVAGQLQIGKEVTIRHA